MTPSFMLFTMIYFSSFIIMFGFMDWFMMWLGLEINMMSFIILIYNQYNMKSIESCFKYFFVQSIGSGILLVFFYLNSFIDFLDFIFLYKVGGGPFYYWFISVCDGVGWVSCFFLMTLQKVIPFMLMSINKSWMMWFFILFSLVVGVLGCFNQSKFKYLISYSSVHHIGWVLMLMLVKEELWMFYMIMYFFVLGSVLFSFLFYEYFGYKGVFKKNMNFIFILSVLSMAGMPPFLGFFMKWFSLYCIVNVSVILLAIMVLLSVIMFYIYFRFVYNDIMMVKYNFVWSLGFKENIMFNWFEVVGVLGFIFGFLLFLY